MKLAYPGEAVKPYVPQTQPVLEPAKTSLNMPGFRYRTLLRKPTGPLFLARRSSFIRLIIAANIGAPIGLIFDVS